MATAAKQWFTQNPYIAPEPPKSYLRERKRAVVQRRAPFSDPGPRQSTTLMG
jgi:hypothetical protein